MHAQDDGAVQNLLRHFILDPSLPKGAALAPSAARSAEATFAREKFDKFYFGAPDLLLHVRGRWVYVSCGLVDATLRVQVTNN